MRVLDADGVVVGAGFLVAPDLVATCAHVVADALGADPGGDAPGGAVSVDFPVAAPHVAASATVRRWEPLGDDGRGDVALLGLGGGIPGGARVPAMRRVEGLWGHRFSVLGFPEGLADGVWSGGELRGGQGLGWFQMQSATGEQPIGPGFSGAPVWDTATGAVVGMTVAVADTPDAGTAYLIPLEDVLGIDPELLPNPYRGLEPFAEEHATFFFGRERTVARLVDLVAAQTVVAVVGPSGSGKSSLLRAGLLPWARSSGRSVVDVRPRPGMDLPAGAGSPLLVLDQFEELAAADGVGASTLLRAAWAWAAGGSGARVVLTLRPESVSEVLAADTAALLEAGTVLVPPMDREQLRDAVVGPAHWAPGLVFADGLVDRILDDTGLEPGRLPLLELLLAQLWERRDGGSLTFAGYRAAGGVAGSISRQAEAHLGRLDAAARVTLQRLLLRLVGTDREGRFVRRPVAVADLTPEQRALLPGLEAARLAVTGTAGDDPSVELAHQALIEHWPRLQTWLREDRDFIVWGAETEQARERWERSRRDGPALLDGATLIAARDWIARRGPDVPAASVEFVRRSARRRRRRTRRWRGAAAALAVLAVLAGGLAAVSIERGDRLSVQLDAANAETLGRLATARMTGQPDVAVHLALLAYRADPSSPGARAALAAAYTANRTVTRLVPAAAGAVRRLWATPDGHTALVRSRDEVITVLEGLPDRPSTWVLPGTAARSAAALSPDGRWAVETDPTGTLRVWDVRERRGPLTLWRGRSPARGSAATFAVSPDSRRLAFLPDASPTPGAPGGRPLLGWTLPDLAPLPAGPDLGREPGPTDIRLTEDPDQVVVLHPDTTKLQPVAGMGSAVRSVRTGAVLRPLAPDSVIAEGWDLGCETAPGAPPTPVVRRTATGQPTPARFLSSTTESFCRPYRPETGGPIPPVLSADGAHVVEPDDGGLGTSNRVVALADGADSRAVVPSRWSAGESSLDPVVSSDSAGRRVLLVARGGALAVVPADAQWTEVSSGLAPDATTTRDGRFEVVESVDALIARDAATGRPLGVRPHDPPGPDRTHVESVGRDGVSQLVRSGATWTDQRLSVPDLRPVARFDLPCGPGPGPGVAVAELDGRSTVLCRGMLSVWDSASARPLRPPVPLGATPLDADRYSRAGSVTARPGHPGQVAIAFRDGSVELWDTGTPRILARTPASNPDGYARRVLFDRDGDRLYTSDGSSISTWRADDGQPVRPRTSVPEILELVAVTEDGYVATTGGGNGLGGGSGVALWDLQRGVASGVLEAVNSPDDTDPDGREVHLDSPRGSITLPLTGRAWFEHLCRAAGRASTPAESALLPPGTDPSPPCE